MWTEPLPICNSSKASSTRTGQRRAVLNAEPRRRNGVAGLFFWNGLALLGGAWLVANAVALFALHHLSVEDGDQEND